MTDKPTEPTTEAGRALLAYVDRVSVDGPMPVTAEDILAIEGQARQQSERDVLALREALEREMKFGCHCGTAPCRNVALLDSTQSTAQAIEDGIRAPLLARIQELRGLLERIKTEAHKGHSFVADETKCLFKVCVDVDRALSTPDPSPVADEEEAS